MIVGAAIGATAPNAKKKTVSTAKKSAVRRPSGTARPGAAAVRRPVATTPASRKKAAPVKRAVTWRNRQLAPTADRYKEIQQALVAKGYLQPGQATGTWDQTSADAMKRFQAEQNIDASGKVNSLSLIALGLGPKHDALPVQIAAPAPEQVNR
jgi:peptidoglycan hydrolase-like protein with peptidoglycan-binding domain